MSRSIDAALRRLEDRIAHAAGVQRRGHRVGADEDEVALVGAVGLGLALQLQRLQQHRAGSPGSDLAGQRREARPCRRTWCARQQTPASCGAGARRRRRAPGREQRASESESGACTDATLAGRAAVRPARTGLQSRQPPAAWIMSRTWASCAGAAASSARAASAAQQLQRRGAGAVGGRAERRGLAHGQAQQQAEAVERRRGGVGDRWVSLTSASIRPPTSPNLACTGARSAGVEAGAGGGLLHRRQRRQAVAPASRGRSAAPSRTAASRAWVAR